MSASIIEIDHTKSNAADLKFQYLQIWVSSVTAQNRKRSPTNWALYQGFDKLAVFIMNETVLVYQHLVPAFMWWTWEGNILQASRDYTLNQTQSYLESTQVITWFGKWYINLLAHTPSPSHNPSHKEYTKNKTTSPTGSLTLPSAITCSLKCFGTCCISAWRTVC